MRIRAGKADDIFSEDVDVTFMQKSHGLVGRKDSNFPLVLGLHPRGRPSVPGFPLPRLVENPVFQRLRTTEADLQQVGWASYGSASPRSVLS